MKSFSHVYENLMTPENLESAIFYASKYKGQKSKVTQQQIEWVNKNKDFAITYMQMELQRFINDPKHTVLFHRHPPVMIHDNSCGKDRIIVKPPFLYEQIYHHAIIQVIVHIITKGMYEYSCASIPGRGSTYGKAAIEKFIKNHPEQCKYYLKMDIHHFFQSIDHDLLYKLISTHVKDEKYMLLIRQLLWSYEDSHGKGLPIGYYTSQWFANWYLQSFDHYVKEQLHAPFYIRYMDDMVIFCSNKRELRKMQISIIDYMNNIGLVLNDKTVIYKLNDTPLNFMGYIFHFKYTTLRKNIMIHSTRLARRINKNGYDWLNCCRELSLLGWVERTDSYNVYLKYIKPNIDINKLKETVSKHAKNENIRKYMMDLYEKVEKEREEMKEVYEIMLSEGMIEYYYWTGEEINFIGPAEIELNNILYSIENSP